MTDSNAQSKVEVVPPASTPQPSDASLYRTAGWLFVGLGLVCAAVTIGWPLYQAHQGVKEIRLSMKLSMLPVFLVLFGSADVLGVRILDKLFEDKRHVTLYDVLVLAGLGVVGGGFWWWFKSHIEALGYRF